MSHMKSFALGLVVLAISAASGCSLCCSPYNDDYTTFGSRTPRLDMKNGRVGSPMSDSQVTGANYVVDSQETFDYSGEDNETVFMGADDISLGTDR